jgi:uncharacterized protein YwgA
MYKITTKVELANMLASFVSFLEASNLINFSIIQDENDKGFVNRLRIQKYVYLAKYYGLDLGYSYTMYRYGPYSPDLTAAYYSLADFNYQTQELPATFNAQEFVSLVSNKDENWLEIATTLLHQYKKVSDKDALVKRVESIKCNYTADYIRGVLIDLTQNNLV